MLIEFIVLLFAPPSVIMHVHIHLCLIYYLVWFKILYKQKYIILKELIRMGIIILRYNCNVCHNIFICCIVYLFIWWTTLYCAVTTYSVALCPWSTCHSTNLCLSSHFWNHFRKQTKYRKHSQAGIQPTCHNICLWIQNDSERQK